MNNYRFTVYIIFQILIIVSCENQTSNEVKQVITNNNYRFWQVYDLHDSTANKKTFEYFDASGNWLLYEKYDNKPIQKWHRGDIYYFNEFEVVNDTILSIARGSFYIIDTIKSNHFIITDVCNQRTKKYVIPQKADLKELERFIR